MLFKGEIVFVMVDFDRVIGVKIGGSRGGVGRRGLIITKAVGTWW